MIHQYQDFEGDGMDPGLSELTYDGMEYGEMDEFGERIDSGLGDDELLDDDMDDDSMSTETGTDDAKLAE